MGMFVYLDETGDTGFKFNKGSSRFFVVTILLTTDPLPLNSAIDEFRRSNHFGDWHEFKFYSSPDSVREQFLRIMLRHEGLIRCLVIDKHLLMQPHMRQPDIFYNYLLKMLLVYNNNRLNDATLILDEREKGKRASKDWAPIYGARSIVGANRKLQTSNTISLTDTTCFRRWIWLPVPSMLIMQKIIPTS